MASRAAGLLAALRVMNPRQRLRRAATRHVRTIYPGRLDVVVDDRIHYAHDALIRRVGDGVEISLSSYNPRLSLRHDAERLPAYLYWLTHCEPAVAEVHVTLSDGDRPSNAIFAPSTRNPEVTALPDPLFFASRGYARERALSLREAPPWEARNGELLWRGGMNSLDSFDLDVARHDPRRASQRLLACLALRERPQTDVKFFRAHQPDVARAVYEAAGLVGARVDSSNWLGRKYALDIDGYTNAWSNLFTRLLFGCCVLKVESSRGYRQWYYDRLIPWRHYVPVAADLSDIHERLDWVRTNDRQAREIAQRGRRLALEMTLSTVTAEAAALIGANWRRKRG